MNFLTKLQRSVVSVALRHQSNNRCLMLASANAQQRAFSSRQRAVEIDEDSRLVNSLTKQVIKQHELPPGSTRVVRLAILESLASIRNGDNKQHGGSERAGESADAGANPLVLKLARLMSRALTIVMMTGAIIFLANKLGYFKIDVRLGDGDDDMGERSDISLGDVVGIDEAKEELQDVVNYLSDPDKYERLGAKIPKGILLSGPPGCGKTMLAKAVAGEAGVPFFNASGSEFDEMYVGVGASRVRKLFQKARENAPSIVFIDEIDAVGSKRSNDPNSQHTRQTINQLLNEMDGFKTSDDPVIVMAATNTEAMLDKALTRPGRFDTTVQVQPPDIRGRRGLLELYLLKTSTILAELNLDKLASLTIGMSGADIMNVVNQAALYAAKHGKDVVEQPDLEFALDKIKMGPEAKSRVRTEKDIKSTAYHEAGHALVAYYTPAAMDIYKATIRQRGSLSDIIQPTATAYYYSDRLLMSRNGVSLLQNDLQEIFGR